jgi:hypothetical protein
MGQYRQSRGLEASTIDWLTTKLADAGWGGIRIEKAFANVYKGILPCICINTLSVDSTKLEIGSKSNIKYYEISIRIFATSDGNRLDLADFITDLLEDDIDFYIYTVTNGVVSSKVKSGKIVILNFLRNEKELTNTENLELIDKFRHIITFRCYIAD